MVSSCPKDKSRNLTKAEVALIERLVAGTKHSRLVRIVSDALVEDMHDGGMGSVRFCNQRNSPREFGHEIAEVTFVDEDGTPCSVTLNLDQHGELFELDIWKADNSLLLRYPTPGSVQVVTRSDG